MKKAKNHEKRLELHSAAPRATLTPHSCSPNFPRAQYLDVRTLTHELIVKFRLYLQYLTPCYVLPNIVYRIVNGNPDYCKLTLVS